MMQLFRRLARRHFASSEVRVAEARAFLDTPPAPMPAVRPPDAANDDPLRPVYAEVERELRVAGLIR